MITFRLKNYFPNKETQSFLTNDNSDTKPNQILYLLTNLTLHIERGYIIVWIKI